MAGRPAQPWFYAAKNTWYVWDGDKKVSLGVRGEANKAEALKAWHRLIANGKPMPEAKAEAPTVAEVVKEFLADAEARLKPATLRGYRDFLEPFSKHLGKVKADRITPAQAEAYARKPGWSNSTRHDFLSALAVAFRWAEQTQRLAGNPLRHLRKPPMESRGDKALVSNKAHTRLMKKAPVYFKPFLTLLYLTGARPGEVAAITAENFDEGNALVRLKEHKTARHGKSRTIFLCPEAVALLREQRAEYGSGHLLRNRLGLPYTKNAVVHMMASLRKKAGVKGATAYGYRHAWATAALAKGVPDAQVAALMGHSGTAMLHRHYSHLTAQGQALREALVKVRAG
jgi:integrase